MKIEEEVEKRKNNEIWSEIKNLPRYTTTAALLFLILGSLLLYFSENLSQNDSNRYKAILAIGFILFLPGLYATFVIINVIFHVEGYSIDDIPSYEDVFNE